MKPMLGQFLGALLVAMAVGEVRAQAPNPAQVEILRAGDNPIYRVTINVVERHVKAVNYRHRGGATKVDFRGTALLPDSRGEAKIESKQGYIEIEVEFDELRPAGMFGPEYLTYVLWAITPEGRATSLGEVILNGTESKLNVTTELQAFGLIVTAEPYFSVTQPSDVVVMENFIRKDTVGKVEEIEAKFELLERGQYVVNALPADLKASPLDSKTPLDLAQARNAVRIATWAGAQGSAPDVLQKAKALLSQAEAQQQKNGNKKTIATISREAVQVAEDARLVTLKRQEEARLAAERQASVDREAKAKAATEAEARLRTQAEATQRLETERRARAEVEERLARERAEVARLDADRARLEATKANDEARIARESAAADAERARLEATRANEDARVAREKAAADTEGAHLATIRANDEVRLTREKADADVQEARNAAQRAEREKAELRARLIQQFNLILETRDSARGLIVNMSDVLFDTGQHTLKPGAREKLARVSGVILAHPGLTLEIEGHTDAVGGDESNLRLSERRAKAVETYLAEQRVAASSITARGLGETQPVATNDTPAGRQQNRRVELIVSGDLIGAAIQTLAK